MCYPLRCRGVAKCDLVSRSQSGEGILRHDAKLLAQVQSPVANWKDARCLRCVSAHGVRGSPSLWIHCCSAADTITLKKYSGFNMSRFR